MNNKIITSLTPVISFCPELYPHCIPAGWELCTQWLVCLYHFIILQTHGSHAKMFISCTFCFEFVVFLLPSLFGLLDELGDCELSDPNCPLILGRDTELLRELIKREGYFIGIYIFHILYIDG